ncbi:MAG: prephenate dehydrogenase [Firmicutes bacterium]|nr:prephenate dehydrogenase [Bacillota bacterium]
MTVGVVGLGLIGGSLAKAYKRRREVTVLGNDRDRSILDFARLAEALDGTLTDERLGECDIILLAAYPQGVVDWVREKAPLISPKTLVLDCSGTKKRVCDACFPIAEQYGFTFVGGHPMAGTQHSGFKFSREDLFDEAPMVIVPPRFDDIRLLDRVRTLLAPVRFGRISVTTAQEHDDIIAFTSQMAHVASNAYIKSPTAARHQGFSAGSYKDMTRVAWLNPQMWAELFLENKEALLTELETYIAALGTYRDALSREDRGALVDLLEEGRLRKQEVDGP